MGNAAVIVPEQILFQESMDIKRREAMVRLEKLYGICLKRHRPLSKEEKDKIALSLTPKEEDKLLKRFGLKN